MTARRAIALLIVGAALVLSAVACGGNDNSSANGETTPATTTADETTTEETTTAETTGSNTLSATRTPRAA